MHVAWKRRSPGMSGASIDRIDGGGPLGDREDPVVRSQRERIDFSSLRVSCATQRPGAKRPVSNARRRA